VADAGHGIPGAGADEATAAMRSWYQDFLAREPYIRPEERNLPG
jgi:hypothetical protein